MSELESILSKGKAKITAAADLKALEGIRVELLGKQGRLTELLRNLGSLSESERPKVGQAVNEAKVLLTELIRVKKEILEQQASLAFLQSQTIDVTVPGRGMALGAKHPITITLNRIQEWFLRQGFSLEEGPEVEDDFHNFEALNIPPYHPARAMHDTFYFPDGKLLRAHTSPVQIRAMREGKPPFRMIAAGKVYRCDFDVTHTPMFHQVEGLVVDEGIHFGHLKGILEDFLSAFFEQSVKARFRSSYFPFTEPSAEVDMQCVTCQGKGCRICSHTGWLEMLGCGMVHPKVLENGLVGSQKYSGFAFGMGVERLAMIRYGVTDLRAFFENDLRFLEQFRE